MSAIRHYKLNPFFRVRLKKPLICELFLQGKELELPSWRYLHLIHSLRGEHNHEELSFKAASCLSIEVEQAKSVIDDLIENQILVDTNFSDTRMEAINHWIKRGWDEALALHFKTRDIHFDDSTSDDPDTYNREAFKSIRETEPFPGCWTTYTGEHISLPKYNKEWAKDLLNFEQALLQRRSHGPWRKTPIEISELSHILHLANAETRRLRLETEDNLDQRPEMLLNSAFSAIESYLLIFNVAHLQPGLYHYNPKNHSLTLIKKGMFREDIAKICIGQQRPAEASCAVILTSVWERYMYRYRHPRAYRTLLINIAELAQKYLILATQHRFGTFLTPALKDEYAENFMGLESAKESPLYVVAFG